MHRRDLRQLSRLRIREARVLLRAGAFAGAYYLAGYAVECVLNACAARKFRPQEIPERKLVNDLHTHELERLLDIAGMHASLEREGAERTGLLAHWNVVKDWKATVRYNPRITSQAARELYSACAGRRSGVLSWLRTRWRSRS